MNCPFCGAPDTKVTDSRVVAETNQIRRRRQCNQCNERFTSYETIEIMMPRVIKSDQSRVSFDLERIRNGMLKALEKRPVSTEDIDDAINRITQRIRTCGEKEIPSQQIGEWVMEELRELDEVAYVRFASVYRHFQDLESFHKEIAKMLKR
jgi:transcriptional repressor NrdR